jgi:hypothetical protein
MAQLWPTAATRPLLAGPDDAGDGDDSSRVDFATLVASQRELSAITFHAYAFHHGGGATLEQDMLNVTKIDAATFVYDEMVAVVRRNASLGYTPEVWMGEGNAAGYGGRPGITNTFENSLWYVNAMGHAATRGIARFLRQTLVGGGYELLNSTTFEPNPDYWSALLFHRHVGAKMLSVTVAPEPNSTVPAAVRVYSACAGNGSLVGDVVFIVVNFAPETTTMLSNLGGTSASLWQLRAGWPNAPECRSSTAALLGVENSWVNLTLTKTGDLPTMDPVTLNEWGAGGGAVDLPSCSVTFIRVHGVNALACM